MRTKTYSILYLNHAKWTTVNDESGKRMEFTSVDDAKRHIDSLRKEKTHPINKVKYAVIYQFDRSMMVGAGIRY